MKHLKLGTKLLIGGILIVAIPIIVIGIVSVYQATENTFKDKQEDMAVISENLAGALEVSMREQLFSIKNISYSGSIITAAEKVAKGGEAKSRQEMALAEKELIKIKKSEGDRLSSINIIGKNGIFIISSDIKTFKGTDISKRGYFTKALNGTANVGSVNISSATGRVVCNSGAPIYSSNGKDIVGVVTMSLALKFFSDIFEKTKIGKAGYAYIIDKNGLYITHPVKDKILKENIYQIKGMESVAELVRQGSPGVTEYTLEGIRNAAVVSPVPITGWCVVSTIPVEELYAPARFTRNVILAIGIIFLLLASVVFYLFSRNLTRPLINLVEAAQKISGGDMTVEITSADRQDEIGTLARAFILMIKSLKEKAQIAEKIAASDLTVKVNPLSDKDVLGNAFATMVDKLRSQTQGIMEGFSILSSAANEILASTTQVASGTAESAAAISETTTTVEEVRQASQLSSEKAQNVSEKAQRVAQVSQSGQKAVEEMVVGIENIRIQMESIAQTIVRLSEQSQSIGGIIASVTDIADQSNLLSVNAAIEASRAGEQGKGFTVVAQEIKLLAEQSKQATTQIRAILNDVQKTTSAAVMATEQGSKAVELCVKQSTRTGEAIRVLAESSAEAAQTATQIVASSQQQVAGMDQIGTAMQNINQAGAQTAASMRQVETAAQNLNELGQKLKGMVEQFKR